MLARTWRKSTSKTENCNKIIKNRVFIVQYIGKIDLA